MALDNMHIGTNKTKNNWKWFLFIFILSLLVHSIFIYFIGIQASNDYRSVYEPTATELIKWLKGAGEIPGYSGYSLLTHLTYILFTSFVFFLFGNNNLFALITFQVLLSSFVYLLVLHVSIKHYSSSVIAAVFTFINIVFFNHLLWTRWAVPGSLYRFLCMVSFFLLLYLYFNKKYILFLVVTVMSSVVLISTRIDTIILFIPMYLLFIRVAVKELISKKIQLLIPLFMTIPLVFLFHEHIGRLFQISMEIIYGKFISGDVIVAMAASKQLPGLTAIDGFDYSQADNVLYLINRGIKLFILRAYQYINIWPPLWSASHKIYYALEIVPIYILTIAGIFRVIKMKDKYFLMIFLFYFFSIILHGLTRVDSALRTSYTPTTFLILFAGYGFDYLYEKYGRYLPFQSKVKNL